MVGYVTKLRRTKKMLPIHGTTAATIVMSRARIEQRTVLPFAPMAIAVPTELKEISTSRGDLNRL